MVDEMTKVKLTMHIPFNTPNKNGTVFIKEAIENAVNNIPANMPIIYRSNKDEKVIGFTTSNSHVIWDSENQVCKMTVDGVMFHCNPLIIINEIEDEKITDFRIASIGLTI